MKAARTRVAGTVALIALVASASALLGGCVPAAMAPDGSWLSFSSSGGSSAPPTMRRVELPTLAETTAALDVGISGSGGAPMLVDGTGTFAYAISGTSPGRVAKVRLADGTRVASLLLPTGIDAPTAAIIAPDGQRLWLSTRDAPATIVELRLSDLTVSRTLSLGAGEGNVSAAAISPDGATGYFLLDSSPTGRIARVDLAAMTESGAPLALAGSGALTPMMAPGGASLYVTTDTTLERIDLASFTVAATAPLPSPGRVFQAAIAPSGGSLYLAYPTGASPDQVLTEVSLPTMTPGRSLTISSGPTGTSLLAIDPTSTTAYVGAPGRTPAGIVGVDLATMALTGDAWPLASWMIDVKYGTVVGGRLIACSTNGTNDVIVLSAPGLSLIHDIALPAESGAYNSFTSPDGGTVYTVFAGSDDTSVVAAFRASDLTRIARRTLPSRSGAVNSAILAPDGHALWLITGQAPARLHEIRTSDLAVTRSLTLGDGGIAANDAAAISPDGRYGYFALTSTATFLVAFDLKTLTEVGRVTVGTGGTNVNGLVLSPDGSTGYAVTNDNPAEIAKIDLVAMRQIARGTVPVISATVRQMIGSPDGMRLYLLAPSASQPVAAVSTDDLSTVRTYTRDVGASGQPWMLLSPDWSTIYTAGIDDTGAEVQTVAVATPHVLTVAVTGHGAVRSAPAAIDCTATCARGFPDYLTVGLTATPAAGSVFTGWGGACSGTGACAVPMTEARRVTATFATVAPGPQVVPAARFTQLRPVAVATNGAVTIRTTLAVPGPGTATLTVLGVARAMTPLCRARARAAGAGRITLTCSLGAAFRRRLALGAVRLQVRTAFAPTGGDASTRTVVLVLPKAPLRKPTPPPPTG